MRQQIAVYVIIALFGLGIGVGSGVLITKSKVDKSKAIITDLQSRMQKSEMISQERIQDADAKIIRLNSELTQVKTELDQVKSGGREVTKTSPAENTGVKDMAAGAMDNTQRTATTVYIVKEGDSLWEIAASQLGDGNRYKEIMKLNPNVSTDAKNLAVGTKLKMPTR
jgi:nucleoid-associated protein YgaU